MKNYRRLFIVMVVLAVTTALRASNKLPADNYENIVLALVGLFGIPDIAEKIGAALSARISARIKRVEPQVPSDLGDVS